MKRALAVLGFMTFGWLFGICVLYRVMCEAPQLCLSLFG